LNATAKRAVRRAADLTVGPGTAFFLGSLIVLLPAHKAMALDCENAVTTVDMIKCADRDYAEADKRLNAYYGELRAGMDETARKLLRNSQRAWIAYRDAECERIRDIARDGTMAPILQISCLADLTEQRIQDLEAEGEPLPGK